MTVCLSAAALYLRQIYLYLNFKCVAVSTRLSVSPVETLNGDMRYGVFTQP